MNTPVRIALPVPPAGTALDGSGEAYIASLSIRIANADGAATSTSGDTLEGLLMALNLRAKAFHPRTFAFTPLEIDGPRLAALIDRNWSSVDASGAKVLDLAAIVQDLASRSATIRFEQAN